MSEEPSNTNKATKTRNKPRRWPKVLSFLLLLLTLLIGITQGPGLRYFLQNLLEKELYKSGLRGSFRVEGSLFSGIQLRAVNLSSKGHLREIRANYLAIDYNLPDLLDKKIHTVSSEGLEVWIDLSAVDDTPEKQTASTSTPTTGKSSAPITLEEIRQLILPVRILSRNSNILITRDKQRLWEGQDISLTHQPGADDFHLGIGQLTDMNQHLVEKRETTFTWSHNHTSLTHFPLRADTEVTELICDWDNFIPEHIQTKINWSHGDFSLHFDHLQTARLQLERGEIHLDQIAPWIGLKDQLAGTITKLQVSAEDILAAPDQLDAKLQLTGSNLSWGNSQIGNLHIKSSINKGELKLLSHIQLDQEQASTFQATANLPKEQSRDWSTCWHNASSEFNLTIPQTKLVAEQIGLSLNLTIPPGGWPGGSIQISGNGQLDKDQPDTIAAKLQWTEPAWAGVTWQSIQLDTLWNHQQQSIDAKLSAKTPNEGTILAAVDYDLPNQSYRGSLNITDFDIAKLTPALELFDHPPPMGGLVNLNWSGTGTIPDIHSYQGELDGAVTALQLSPETQLNINLSGEYAENLQIHLKQAELNQGELTVKTAGSWDQQTIQLTKLELHDKDALLVTGTAEIPLDQEINNLDSFLRQKEDCQLNLKINQLPLAEIYEQLPPSDEAKIKGTLSLDFTLDGPLLTPDIQLTSQIKRVEITSDKPAPLSDVSIELGTDDGQIQLTGKIIPDGHNPILLNGKMPYNPETWIDDPKSILQEDVDVVLDTRSINLSHFENMLPHISELHGKMSALVKVGGTIAEPKITGESRIDIKRITHTRESAPNLRDIDIQLKFENQILTIAPSSCLLAGGKYSLKGQVNFNQWSNPVFDVSLLADKALLWRDDSIITRADADLHLTGPYEKANIAGNIGIVQSLFYKDVHIIPLGSPGGTSNKQPGKAELPIFTQPNKAAKDRLDIPAPFNAWTLNVNAQTKDDFLIRGNIAKGNVSGVINVTGTLANPQPKGELTLKNAQASLPFSRLHVKEGKAFFSPKHGFDPQLSIKATSKIGSHNVDITLYGLASKPQTLMTSSPPLPENEIIFLLATGSTSDRLTDGAAATGKAYQLLVDSVLRSSPGKFTAIMEQLNELNQRVDINIGAADPFTGRKYNSASLEITERWHVVASIDLDNNTRGLVVYSIQFK